MSDKHLSGEEKRKLLKEQYKRDLKQRKEFLSKTKNLRTLQNMNRALSGMTPEDDTDDWINQLNEESALSDAKMEMAIDTAKEREEREKTDEEMQEIIAKNLVEDMKREMAEEAGIFQTQAEGDIVEKDIFEGEIKEPQVEKGEVEGEADVDAEPPKKTFGDLEF